MLTHEIEKFGLKSGDLGTVVHCYKDQKGFKVEFITEEGKTIAEVTLTATDLRSYDNAEILHAGELTPSV